MSIQINGIDKPKSCFDCPCIDAEFEECAAREHYLLPKDEYGAVLGDVPDWCPITEPQTCDDAVSRAAAIDALWKALYAYEDKTERQFQESDELKVDDWIVHRIFVQNMSDIDRQTILNLPAVQPQRKTDEWCSDCKEYDQEKHCCPRFNRVIRQTLSEQRKTGKWIPCSERLPEEAYPVIVTWKNDDPASYYQYILGKHYVGVAHYKNGKWYWYSSITEDVLMEYGRCESEEFDEAIRVLAWMPLQEPYKGDEL